MSPPPRTLEVFELLDHLDVSAQSPTVPSREGEAEAQTQTSGRVFRVKLGYNPNSSSLGTSVVTLVWGVGLAGIVFQWVGSWLLAPDGPCARALPPPQPSDTHENGGGGAA